MTEFNWEILVPIIIALIAAIPGILSLLKGRKKESADTANVLVGTSLELLIEIKKKAAKAESDIKKLKDDLSQEIIRHEAESAQQQEKIDSLQVQIDHLNDQILKYKKTQNLLIRGIKILIKQLEENKIKPNWNIDVDGLEIIE
jgi:predicted RNase H-like nuclease (RuvC/YqgF family)